LHATCSQFHFGFLAIHVCHDDLCYVTSPWRLCMSTNAHQGTPMHTKAHQGTPIDTKECYQLMQTLQGGLEGLILTCGWQQFCDVEKEYCKYHDFFYGSELVPNLQGLVPPEALVDHTKASFCCTNTHIHTHTYTYNTTQVQHIRIALTHSTHAQHIQ
jgi:hypothetical protein